MALLINWAPQYTRKNYYIVIVPSGEACMVDGVAESQVYDQGQMANAKALEELTTLPKSIGT